jgi:hypothetical protein
MIRKRHLALGNKGLAVNSIQMLLLQLAPNAGFSKKVYTVVLMVVAVVLYKCFFLVSSSLSRFWMWKQYGNWLSCKKRMREG